MTNRIVLCSTRWMRDSSSCSVSRVCASSAPNGSSIRMIAGSLASARAMATRCFIPPESWAGYFSACASQSDQLEIAIATVWRRSAAGRPRSVGPNSTLPVTVSQGKSAYSWKTTPRSGAGPFTGRPSTTHGARRRRQEARHDVQQRRLPAARRPQEAHELAARPRPGRPRPAPAWHGRRRRTTWRRPGSGSWARPSSGRLLPACIPAPERAAPARCRVHPSSPRTTAAPSICGTRKKFRPSLIR